jgi:hypothetical protein
VPNCYKKTPASCEAYGYSSGGILSDYLLIVDEDYIPCPSSNLCALRISYLCAVAELIAMLIHMLRLFMVEFQLHDIKFGKRLQLAFVRDAVMVGVSPQPEFREDYITTDDDAITVAAEGRLIKLGKRKETVVTCRQGSGVKP